MGCHFTKSSGGKSSKDGKGKSKNVEEPPPPPDSDPRIPLTARQKFNISKSWKGINRAMEQTGIQMFLK